MKHSIFRNGKFMESFPDRAQALKHLRWLLATYYPCCAGQDRREARKVRWVIAPY